MTILSNISICQPEDVLAYLLRKPLVEYCKNQLVYSQQHPPDGLFLVLTGRVKVATTVSGSDMLLGIFGANELFGEVALLGRHVSYGGYAAAIEKTMLMVWPLAEIKAQIDRQPRLGLALIQLMV